MEREDRKDAALSFLRRPDEVASELAGAARSGESPPLYLREAQRRATALGLDLSGVLADDAKRVERFPTAECITPAEVEAYWTGDGALPEQRATHVRECAFCGRVLDAAQPSEEQLQRFLDELGSLPARVAARRSEAPTPASA